MKLDIEKFKSILNELSKERPIFHSEADFQHELAFKMHRNNFIPRLEVPYNNLPLDENNSIKIELDLLLNNEIGIELKYKTQRLDYSHGEESFSLKNHGARNLGRFDFLDDIRRLEILKENNIISTGFALLLTNDKLYWEDITRENFSEEFSLERGKKFIKNQEYNWTGDPKVSSFGKQRLSPFVPMFFKKSFDIEWLNYSDISTNSKYGSFNYTIIQV